MPQAESIDRPLNEHGMTELHIAAYEGELSWVRNCIGGGMNVNAVDRAGYTPLHWVADMSMVGRERFEVARALLDAGANPQALDAQGNTPAEVARLAGNEQLAELIARHGL